MTREQLQAALQQLGFSREEAERALRELEADREILGEGVMHEGPLGDLTLAIYLDTEGNYALSLR